MIVLETSAVVDALVGEAVHPELLARLADEELHAPSLLDYEVASALRGHVLAGKIARARLEEAVADFTGLRIERYEMTAALPRILDLRDNFTVYDAAYVVLAVALEAPLVTSDEKMREAERLGVAVHVYAADDTTPGSG
ncbi:MAG: type II toxin-antitoxin system VapC family toxin [Streptosporangiales bacterium]